MLSPTTPSSSTWIRGIFLLGLFLVGVAGCTSPRTVQEVARDRADVLGTWEYRTENISALQHGTLQIMVQDGRLTGRFQDSWRGSLNARVNVHGSQMELTLDRIRISGRLEQRRFTASVRREFWDASTAGSRRSRGYFVARRVRSSSMFEDTRPLGCPSLLREVSYTCSPLISGRP